MAMVERRDLGLSEPLSEGDDACVDNAETEVTVARLKLAAACNVG